MAGVYRPRHPERPVLYRVLFHHFDRFLTEHEDRFEREYRLGDLCRCALRSLSCYFEAVTGSVLTPGVIAVIQTFGDRINLYVHLHFLVTEGKVGYRWGLIWSLSPG